MSGKTQPQELLEEIIPRNEDEQFPSDPDVVTFSKKEFPSITAQLEHWDEKEKAPKLRYCPCCGKNIERFLA